MRIRRPLALTAATVLALGLAGGVDPLAAQDLSNPGPGRNSHGAPPLEAAKLSRLTLSQTIERSEKELNGRAVEATFTPHPTGGGSHEIVVLKPDGTLTRNHIDGRSEALVGRTDEKVASLVTSLTPEAVAKARKGLLNVVREVEGRSPDHRVIGAAAEQDEGVVSYEVTVATPAGDETLHLDDQGAPKPD